VLLGITLGLAALYVKQTQPRIVHGHHHADFEVFYRGARVAAARENLYEPSKLRAAYPYVYPPLLVSLLRPWLWLSYPTAALAWNLLQLLFLALGFDLLRRLLLAHGSPAPPLMAGAAIAVGAWPLAMNVIWIQVNLLVWLVVLGALLALRQGRLLVAGALVALGFLLKVAPAVLVLVALGLPMRRAARFLAGVAVGLLAFGLMLPGLISGFGWTIHMTVHFFALLFHVGMGGREALPWGNNCANQSLLFALYQWVGRCAPTRDKVDPAWVAATYQAIRATVALGTLAGGLLLRGKADRVAWALFLPQVLLAMILGNPITWAHHFFLLTPAVALLGVAPFLAEAGSRLRLTAAGAAVAFAAVMGASHELEGFKPGTSSLAFLLLWAVVTGMLAAHLLHRRREPGGLHATPKPNQPSDR